MSARGKVAAVATSAGILAAAWSAATLGGNTLLGTPAVANDVTSTTVDQTTPSASDSPGATPSDSASASASDSPSGDPASASATAPGTTAAATKAAATTAAAKTTTAAAPATTAKATTAPATTAKATTAPPASGLKDGTYSGGTVTHQYGSVSVTITVSGGKITSVAATTTTNGDSKSTQINASAIPTLKSRVIAAQSGNISSVSGATYTSGAFKTSAQAAVAKAKA